MAKTFPKAKAPTRQRTEWPSLNAALLTLLTLIQSRTPLPLFYVAVAVKTLMNNEYTRCTLSDSIPLDMHPDAHILIDLPVQKSFAETTILGRVFVACYFRGRIQSAVLKCFLYLYEMGYVDLACLKVPVDLDARRERGEAVERVKAILMAFGGPRMEMEFGGQDIPHELGSKIR